MKKYFLILSILSIFIFTSQVLAETEQIKNSSFDCSEISNNVDIKLLPQNQKKSSGTKLVFSVEIINNNSYPIVDAKLLATISRRDNSSAKNSKENIVDSVILKDGITIKNKSSTYLESDWNIPAYALSGDYQILTSLVSNTGYSLNSGNLNSGKLEFEVFGEQKTDVHLNTLDTKLNDKNLSVDEPITLSANEKGNIDFVIFNDTDKMQEVPFTVELYRWNDQLKRNLLKTDQSTYLLKPNSSLSVPFVLNDSKFSTYYIHAKAGYKDTKSESVITIRRSDVLESPIIFSALSNYPLVKGQENSLITCVGGKEYSKIETKITDSNGVVINQVKPSAGNTKFNPKASGKNFFLETKIFDKSGNIADEIKTEYKCADLMSDCSKTTGVFNFSDLINLKNILFVLGIIILSTIGYLLKRPKEALDSKN